MTNYPDLFAKLAAPFDPNEVKLRSAAGGRQLHYITARTAMNRLDDVLGPENWCDEFVPLEHSVVCRLTITLPDGKQVTKCDAGGYAGMADQGDDDKSGFSDAFKRAAAKFGVARYLYRDGVPEFVRDANGQAPEPPREPAPAPAPSRGPSGNGRPSEAPARGQGGGNGNGGGKYGGPPRTGKALFAWCKEMEQAHQVGLIKYLNGWAKLQDFPGRMIDWDADQVALAFKEGTRKLASVKPADDGYEDALAN